MTETANPLHGSNRDSSMFFWPTPQRPIAVDSQTLRREFPVMFAVIGLAWLLLSDGRLGRFEGACLLAGFLVLIALMVVLARRAR